MNSINKSNINEVTSLFLVSSSCIILSPHINNISTYFEGYLLFVFSQNSKEFVKDVIIIFLHKSKQVFSSFPSKFLYLKAISTNDAYTLIFWKIRKEFDGILIILFIEFKNLNKYFILFNFWCNKNNISIPFVFFI